MRTLIVGLTGAAAIAAGVVSSPAIAGATADDESAIEQVISSEQTAVQGLDTDGYVAVYCKKFQSEARKAWSFGSAPDVTTVFKDQAKLRAGLHKVFPQASDAAISAALAAAANEDQSAWETAWQQLNTEQYAGYGLKVTGVKVTGTKATGKVTESNNGTTTQRYVAQFIQEGGEWKDCTPWKDASDNASSLTHDENSHAAVGGSSLLESAQR